MYHNSFAGSFVYDDTLLNNPRLHHLWPPDALVRTTRPLTDLLFSVNYVLGHSSPWGYHVVNLCIHLLAGLVLFGIVRRTLRRPILGNRYGHTAQWLAWVVTLVWVVHPLQTESVTYIVQRSESLMGLFCLLTLLCTIRSTEMAHRSWWITAAIGACALGMLSKPTMAVTPLLVLTYDRCFLAKSYRQALYQRPWLYLGLVITWGLLAISLLELRGSQQNSTAGFNISQLGSVQYAMTQPGVILHYLRLVFWPHPLIIDYNWPLAKTWGAILPPSLTLGGLLGATLWALRYQPPLGFLGSWFFLTLAPSSSIFPLRDLAFEHRMYLPLVAPIAFAVLGGWTLLERWVPAYKFRRVFAIGLSGGAILALGILTIQRNAIYHDPVTLWRSVIAQQPRNARAHANLATILISLGRYADATTYFTKALEFDASTPRFNPLERSRLHFNTGIAFEQQGNFDQAIAHYTEALQISPENWTTHVNLGNVLLQQGNLDQAIAHYTEALRASPGDWKAHFNLGVAYGQQGRFTEAASHFEEVLKLNPDYLEARRQLDAIRTRQANP